MSHLTVLCEATTGKMSPADTGSPPGNQQTAGCWEGGALKTGLDLVGEAGPVAAAAAHALLWSGLPQEG